MYGDDGVVSFAVLVEIAPELGRSACTLIDAHQLYAAEALARQLVEVEYVLWTFASDSEEARKWINANRDTLLKIFSPTAIRNRAGDAFDANEYHDHCNLGGHPAPTARLLLSNHGARISADVVWLDLCQHLDRIRCRVAEADRCWAQLVPCCTGQPGRGLRCVKSGRAAPGVSFRQGACRAKGFKAKYMPA